MATITSTQNGNWATGATWVGGVEPGVNDDAVVLHDVTVAAKAYCKSCLVKTNGELILNHTLEFTDTAGCGLTIEDDGNFSSNATASTPRTIQSASGDSPTNKWTISVEDVSTATDSRTLEFEYVEFIGNKWRLGNDDNCIDFNTGDDTEPIINSVTPPVPAPRLTIHNCEGRGKPRVYRRGGAERVMTISGSCQLDSFLFQQLDDMEEADNRISLFTRYHHFPVCRLEAAPPGQSRGVHVPFSITVIEDV